MVEIKEQFMQITDVYLSNDQIHVELSTKTSIKLPPYGSRNTQRLIEKLRVPLVLQSHFDNITLHQDLLTFATKTGTKQIQLMDEAEPIDTNEFLSTAFHGIRNILR